ncbi:5-histidylcysteine sulfoxide synthase [Batrachochytrium salamandrivorans]|nr:5-histidylcysteine sulfoxide synthase [Batrachochytrium salamandrivorans]
MQTKQSAMAFFDNGWTLYETLFASLRGEEAFFIPPAHGLRHPMQFYYGHTAALYVNKLLVAGLIPRTIDREFEAQFEVGVDEMRWDDNLGEPKHWPSVQVVRDFREQVYHVVKQVVEKEFASGPKRVDWNHPLWALFMGCEHDRIHLETSAVLIRELPLRLVQQPDYFPEHWKSSTAFSHLENRFIPIAGAEVKLGKSPTFPSYGWDNEYGQSTSLVPTFECSEYLCTNHEFFQFVLAKGYLDQTLWTEEGWEWRRFRNTQFPQFWSNSGPQGLRQDFQLRHLFQTSEMDWSLPVVVNYHEAKAFCNWKSKQLGKTIRLPTEAEHQLILSPEQTSELAQPNQLNLPGNHSLRYGGETPVNLLPSNAKGIYDGMGNVWQWTEDKMLPLQGFEPHNYYLDFTEPCFDGKHQIIKGGSFVSTCDNGVSPHSRFHFRQHFHQMSGFRYVMKEPFNVYETPELATQYLDLHFALPDPNHPLKFASGFPKRCADLVIKHSIGKNNRALDVGCAVGGSTFALTQHFNNVLGVDFSQSFIDLANTMKQTGQVNGFHSSGIPTRAEFIKGDACALQLDDEQFDAVLAANLLCRLPQPLAFLNQLPKLVKPGGIVVLVSPYSWLVEYTPNLNNWLGEVGNSQDQVVEIMRQLGFALVESGDMPLLIKEHPRKFQYIVSNALVFKNQS